LSLGGLAIEARAGAVMNEKSLRLIAADTRTELLHGPGGRRVLLILTQQQLVGAWIGLSSFRSRSRLVAEIVFLRKPNTLVTIVHWRTT
jgi:hypothetical protein